MKIEELELEVKVYNRLKKAGINTADELLTEMYKGSSDIKVSVPDAKRCEEALKAVGIIKYVRGDYVTEDDIEPEPLTWDELHNYIGKLVVYDCSTESHRWLKVNWIYDIKDDDEGTVICSEGSRNYSYIRRKTVDVGYSRDPEYLSRHECLRFAGRMFALKEPELPQAQPSAVIVESADYTKAVTLTRRIKANAQAAQESLWEVCKGLKEMHDSKLYKELGYQNFEEYTENEVGIKRLQARKYVSIASIENGQSTNHFEQLGTEKLYLLSRLDEPQREEVQQNVDVEAVSVRELKKQIVALNNEAAKQRKLREELVDENNQMSNRISALLADNDEAIRDATYQAHAVMMCVLHREFGFGGERLRKLKNSVEAEYMAMKLGVLGKSYDTDDCVKFLKENYNIDFSESMYGKCWDKER